MGQAGRQKGRSLSQLPFGKDTTWVDRRQAKPCLPPLPRRRELQSKPRCVLIPPMHLRFFLALPLLALGIPALGADEFLVYFGPIRAARAGESTPIASTLGATSSPRSVWLPKRRILSFSRFIPTAVISTPSASLPVMVERRPAPSVHSRSTRIPASWRSSARIAGMTGSSSTRSMPRPGC